MRLVPSSRGRAEAEAVHYGQLHVSFAEDPRSPEQPRVQSGAREGLFLVFSGRWTDKDNSEERRSLLAVAALARADLIRHLGYPAEAMSRFLPDGEARPVPIVSLGERWKSGELTMVRSAESPELAEVMGATRDVLSQYARVRTVTVPQAELPPMSKGVAHDMRLVSVRVPSGLGQTGERLLLNALGIPDTSLERVRRGDVAVPLLAFRRVAYHVEGLRGLRYSPAGALVLEDARWTEGKQ